jgi:hypothetical protein
MTIYSIGADYKASKAFTLPMADVLLAYKNQIPMKQLLDFPKHNLALSNVWQRMQATFESIADVTLSETIPDVTTWVAGTLVLSDKAKQLLTCLEGHGEYLPIDTPAGEYWIFNCLEVLPTDEKQSNRTVEQDQFLDIKTIVFSEDDIKNTCIFKTDYDGFRSTFCTDVLKEQITKHKLSGLTFNTNLASPDYM